MKYIVLIVVLVIISYVCISQNKINFLPKELLKNVKKIYKCENPEIVEIENNNKLATDTSIEKYFKINCTHLLGYIYVGRVKTCRATVCSSLNKYKNDGYEFFDYYILYDTMAKVLNVNIFNYEATHGHEITVRNWLKQFTGFDGTEKLQVGKNIDAISGATISVHSITEDVSSKTEKLRKHLLK